MVNSFTFLSSSSTKYDARFKEYLKNNYVENTSLEYESFLTSGLNLSSLDLFVQNDLYEFLTFEFASDIIYKKGKKSKEDKTKFFEDLKPLISKMEPKLKYDAIQITVQMKTNTFPLKLNFYKNKKLLPETIFIKKPCTNRLIGKTMYNFIDDYCKNHFVFNEGFIAVKGIEGNTLEKIDVEDFLNNKKYKENLIRAFVKAKFISLGDITSTFEENVFLKRNLLVTPENKISFIDYGNMFSDDGTKFLQNPRSTRHFLDGMLDAYKDEHRRIASRIDEQHKEFFEFLEVIKCVQDKHGFSVNERVKKYLGSQNLIEHYKLQLDSFSKM